MQLETERENEREHVLLFCKSSLREGGQGLYLEVKLLVLKEKDLITL